MIVSKIIKIIRSIFNRRQINEEKYIEHVKFTTNVINNFYDRLNTNYYADKLPYQYQIDDSWLMYNLGYKDETRHKLDIMKYQALQEQEIYNRKNKILYKVI